MWMPCDITTAMHLAEMDAAMRRPASRPKAINSRVAFYLATIRAGVTRSLNSVGEMVPTSRLSERSMDVVFEDAFYRDDVVAELVAIADRDDELNGLITADTGPTCIALWRQCCAVKQPSLPGF